MHWLACSEHEVPEGPGWLSERELRRLETMRFPKRRAEYRLRRWTGKRAVAGAAGLPQDPPEALARVELLNRLTGAPYVEVDGAAAGIDVSLTDRAGHAVAVVWPGSGEGTVGVDLELVEPRSEGFVTDFLTPGEVAYLRRMREETGEEGWQLAANLVWSAKESALKVIRVGLRADTRTVEVGVGHLVRDDGWAELTVRRRDGRVVPGWWRHEGAFVLTVASATAQEPPEPMVGSVPLGVAKPVHSWLDDPAPS
ncbi:MAG TPA: 4'-phosphopantetheinyl transferase superfamily protein [Phycicoccus sp.]|nr:4'-phosphopantetheinyl transferase superfamily protein [Phycicoccus sp.]